MAALLSASMEMLLKMDPDLTFAKWKRPHEPIEFASEVERDMAAAEAWRHSQMLFHFLQGRDTGEPGLDWMTAESIST